MTDILIRNAMIFDGSGDAPFRGHVRVSGNRIAAVMRGTDEVPQEGAQVIDADGAFLMPGLIEGHGHISFIDQADLMDLAVIGVEEHTLATMHNARKLLEAGFTSVNSAASAKVRLDAVIRDEIEARRIPGPRLRAASPEITVTSGLGDANRMHVKLHTFGLVVDGVDEVVSTVRMCIREGVDNIKLNISGDVFMPNADSFSTVMADPEVRAAVETAHAHGKRVAAHCRAADSVKRAVRNRVDMIYHCDHADEEALDMLEEARDWVLTGPAIGVIIKSLEMLKAADDPALQPQIDELQTLYDDNCWTHGEMMKRGIPIVVGGDYGFSVNPQGTNANDLEHFVKHYGFSEAQTLHCATMIGARAMDMADSIGQVREGFLADLLLIDGDPLSDITLFQDKSKLTMIMKDGLIHATGNGQTAEAGGRSWLAAQ
ncbi:metal-dependent hydrolase family protein [Oceanomicrobium pacificus]|uniref:Amidohydrolase family protein n=1 Tax=Oceanomicrobium pacificus TaxID=2692916 RepID=A0A6B0TZK6_9RHOB|nr:amidohydrolase family protein [Oceanomicrobium pacificus]MXU64331.1 amidohydrolase family protein [Oceanomicrobium pacificus]